MSLVSKEYELLIKEIKLQGNKIDNLERLVKKLVKGEVAEKDVILTTQQFIEKEEISKRQMYYIFQNNPEIKNKVAGFGTLVNYTKYLKIKK